MEQQPRHRRHRVRTECVVRAQRDDRLIADETFDLSWSGVRARALAATRVGERVRVSIRIPGSTTWLDADGVVARVCPSRRAGDEPAAVGVRMDRMDGMLRLLLGTVLRHYPELRPARRRARDYARMVARIAAETEGA